MKFSFNSDKMDYIGNHSMSVISDGENYERIIIFGGISNTIGDQKAQATSGATTPAGALKSQSQATPDVNQVASFLSNRCFVINIQQRSGGKSFFKEEPAGQSKQQAHGLMRKQVSALAKQTS